MKQAIAAADKHPHINTRHQSLSTKKFLSLFTNFPHFVGEFLYTILSIKMKSKQTHPCNRRSGKPERKTKAYSTYIVPQAAYCSCSGAFVSQRERAYSLCRRLSLRPRTLTYDQTAIRSPGLIGLHPVIHVITGFTTHRRAGKLSWPGWLTHSGHFTPEVVKCKP